MAAREVGGTQSLERAMTLLQCFTEEQPELRVTELCAMTGLNQSTVSRMMSALDRIAFVTQDERTGLYRLGYAAIALGSVALNGSAVYRASRQIAQVLAQQTGLGVNVAQLDGTTLHYLANFEGPRSPKSFSMAGRVGILHATGMGKALLATLPPEFVDDYFSAGVEKYTPHTIADRAEFDAAAEDIRNRGYATEIEELSFGRACVAAAIRGTGGHPIAAMSISGPLSVVHPSLPAFQELALRVVEAADDVSSSLGYAASSRLSPV
jgi:DNA-binding IclR family transcriptional regulator